MAHPRIRFTRVDYDRIPEDLRVELIDGERAKLAPPSIYHQQIGKRIFSALSGAVGLERVFYAPVDLPIDDRNALQPDLLVVAEADVPGPEARSAPTPLLVVEVLSPATAARDRYVKVRKYLDAGVREVWLVDPETRSLETRTATESSVFTEKNAIEPMIAPGFRLRLETIFDAS